MEITNYTLSEFAKQPIEAISESLVILQHINPIKTNNDIYHMRLSDVEFIKQRINTGLDSDIKKIVAMVQGVRVEVLERMEIITFFGLVNSIKERLEEITTAEESALMPSYTDPKWEMVGGSKKMAKFGIVNALDLLSNKDATKHEYYNNMKYSMVFLLLLKRKQENDLEREMSLIKT